MTEVPLSDAAPPLRLAARGLAHSERLLLEGLVRMSRRDTRRRMQPLELLPEGAELQADVVLVDARDPVAVLWARQQSGLAERPVIWIDAAAAPPGHTLTRRPVQWPVLPILLARALEQHAARGATRAPAAAPEAAEAARPVRLRPHVLVVDDSPMARLQIRALLGQRGMDVAEADDVAAALRLLQSTAFDAVLMDVLMPGTDGYDGCREVKSLTRGGRPVPVVMLTSKASPFDRIRGKMAGCDAYLAKPVDPEQLHEVLAQHVRGLAQFKPAAPVRPMARPGGPSPFSQPA